ncbi:MAG: hypothetical protein ACFFG0_08895 [Candidatus Thorarchaeota archaeon]
MNRCVIIDKRNRVELLMVQTIQRIQKKYVEISDTRNIIEIQKALNELLHLQNTLVKQNIIRDLIDYLKSRFELSEYKIKIFIAYSEGEPCGFVISDLNPEYKSYGRKCGTFGWLKAKSQEICEILLKHCELFIKENRLRKIRGPINFPKNKMGFGLLVEGVNEQWLYGVATSNGNLELYDYLINCSYEPESEYTCMHVNEESWKKGNTLDKNLKLCCLPLDELEDKLDEIVELAGNSFSSILPDTSGGGRENVEELLHLASNVPKDYFRHRQFYNPFKKYKHIPEFIEAWKKVDLENMITMFPMVLERKTNKLIGILIGVLDYYQYWKGDYISRVNVHTAMVRRGYNGKGVFSSLNNFGQATNRSMRGATYYEGTAIWTKNSKGVNNEEAMNTIFPHCSSIRKHIVFEKRVK